MEAVSPSQESTTPVMNASIWSKTPDHLVERILAFLSVKDVLRMRSVCKAWSSDILALPTFRKLHKEFSPRHDPWFLVSSINCSFSAYDMNTQKWNVIYFPSLPNPDLRVLASSQGLVCYGLSWGEDSPIADFYICNPITREWRHLPRHPERTVDHLGMQYDENTSSYKILTVNVARSGGWIRRLTIYDSRLGQWTETPVRRRAAFFRNSHMVWCGNLVYFMERVLPCHEMHVFNVQQSSWHQLPFAVPQFFEFPSLVACKDRFFMVGLRSDGRKIWEVVNQQGGLELVEYDTLPANLPNDFAVKKKATVGFGRCTNYNPYRLNAVGSSSDLMGFSSNIDHTWMLIYDTKRKTFHESPKHVIDFPRYTYNVDLSFQPCLDASP